jgi:hypothetical protein
VISPAEIIKKAERLWQSQKPLRAEWLGEIFFPIEIPFGKPESRELLENFSKVRGEILALKEQSKEALGSGYEIDFNLWQHRQLGAQALPEKIRISSLEDLCFLIGKSKDLSRWRRMTTLVTQQCPELKAWIGESPFQVLKYASEWESLLAVIDFFKINPRPGLFVRQLQISGVDTKFIEGHKKVLREVLDLILPESAIDKTFSQVESGGFEQRFGLLYDEPLVRFRFLDSDLTSRIRPLSDLSVPLSEFAQISLSVERVFVVENKINALAFPRVPNSIVIFGAGYGISRLHKVPWIKELQLFYWGDLDTHGFSILSTLRSFLPQARSLFMDRETLMVHSKLWVQESKEARCLRTLTNLTDEEHSLCQDLQLDRIGPRIRLEQERIPYEFVLKNIKETLAISSFASSAF